MAQSFLHSGVSGYGDLTSGLRVDGAEPLWDLVRVHPIRRALSEQTISPPAPSQWTGPLVIDDVSVHSILDGEEDGPPTHEMRNSPGHSSINSGGSGIWPRTRERAVSYAAEARVSTENMILPYEVYIDRMPSKRSYEKVPKARRRDTVSSYVSHIVLYFL